MLALKKLEGRRLKVELKSVSKMLRALAEDPMEADPKQLGSAAVAFLRYREQVSWSTGHQQLGGYYLVLCSWLLVRLQPNMLLFACVQPSPLPRAGNSPEVKCRHSEHCLATRCRCVTPLTTASN